MDNEQPKNVEQTMEQKYIDALEKAKKRLENQKLVSTVEQAVAKKEEQRNNQTIKE